MKILINASNRMSGGAVAVTDSICSYLNKFQQHNFVVVLSPYCEHIGPKMEDYPNVKVVYYYCKLSLFLFLFHRDKFLDHLVEREHIDAVLTVWEPYWDARCPHLAGFAQPDIIYTKSPYFSIIPIRQKISNRIKNVMKLWCIKKSTKHIYTENPEVSEQLQRLMPDAKVYTVTSYYHQIYDSPNKWRQLPLPEFHGTTLLTIAAPYPHKNLPITVEVTRILKSKYPDFNFRFVLTLKPEELKGYDDSLKDNFVFIGRVKIEECPSLYVQSDIMWMPTLLECFSGTYAEAMRMKKPIITTDMGFARGTCGEAAKYYSPLSAAEAADVIYNLANNHDLYNSMIDKGTEQLKTFNNSEERASLLIKHLEDIVKE